MKTFSLTTFNHIGEQLASQTVSPAQLDADLLREFSKKVSRLSGDLELPLEAKLPGKFSHLDYRIGSDGHGAYVLFYLHDEVVFAALYLRGEDVTSELELTQVFKFLLLDVDDVDEPSEDEIEAVLSSTAFNFDAVESRPAAFAIKFSVEHVGADVLQHIDMMNRHLAAAFFGC